MRAKSNDDVSRADSVARSVGRASKAVVWGISKTGKTSMALLAYAGRRNQRNAVKGAEPTNRNVSKGGAGTRLKAKNTLQKPGKTRRTLVQQIKAPMTTAEARTLTKALHASDRPTRKLPPRP
ncbi:hypothetical protein [Streptomyces sp. NPDC006334]|uniref:hypothetical protein n=1 Tax=Streptomyces sp. NPDC006334 TaxID=3156754 RepID=UPI0033AED743